jgi:hypothetical protein
MTNGEKRQPVGEVLRGLDVLALPDGWTAIEGAFLVKCLDDEGHAMWALRSSSGINDEELLGALLVQLDVLRKDIVATREED